MAALVFQIIPSFGIMAQLLKIEVILVRAYIQLRLLMATIVRKLKVLQYSLVLKSYQTLLLPMLVVMVVMTVKFM